MSYYYGKSAAGGGGGGGLTYLTGAIVSGGSEDVASLGPIDTTGANLLVFMTGIYSDAGTEVFSDSKGNGAPTLLTRYGAGNFFVQLSYLIPTSVGTGHTFAWDGQAPGFYPILGVMAFSGANASPSDVQNGATNAATNSLQTGSVTPSVSNSLVVAAFCSATVSAHAIDSGFATPIQVSQGVGGMRAGMAYKTGVSVAINPAWSFTGGGVAMAVSAASFKP
jgi:hypothetical protein